MTLTDNPHDIPGLSDITKHIRSHPKHSIQNKGAGGWLCLDCHCVFDASGSLLLGQLELFERPREVDSGSGSRTPGQN